MIRPKNTRVFRQEPANNAKGRALALSMEPLTDTVTVSTRRRIEPRTSCHSSFVCDCRDGRHTLAAVCATLTAFCVTVATSCELVAIVDRDGQSINSARARTPHEPSSWMLMQFAYSRCAAAITLTSAHWQRVGRRPGRPLNAVRSAVKAGACAESCISRTLPILLWGVTMWHTCGRKSLARKRTAFYA